MISREEKHVNCIYRYISPNGKCYVGQARDFWDRHRNRNKQYKEWLRAKDDHNLPLSRRRGANPKLFRAFFKYGIENFDVEIIEENLKDGIEMDEKEIYYIELYDCVQNGYNITKGGSFVNVNPVTGRSYRYKSSIYNASYVDTPDLYLKNYRKANYEKILKYGREYWAKHPEKLKIIHDRNRDKQNARRKISNHYMYHADKEFFGKCVTAICFRRYFGGGRTRSRRFIAPRGQVNEQGCWLFEL